MFVRSHARYLLEPFAIPTPTATIQQPKSKSIIRCPIGSNNSISCLTCVTTYKIMFKVRTHSFNNDARQLQSSSANGDGEGSIFNSYVNDVRHVAPRSRTSELKCQRKIASNFGTPKSSEQASEVGTLIIPMYA